MKTYKIILLLATTLIINEVNGQSSLIKPLIKKGIKKASIETIEYSSKKGVKKLVKFSTEKNTKQLLRLVNLNSKKGITRKLAQTRVLAGAKGKPSSSKLLRHSTKKIEKAVIRTDIKEYAAKHGYRIVKNKKSISFFNKEGVYLGKRLQSGERSVIIAPELIINNSSKLKYLVNPILDNPLPNSIYKVGNTTFITDKYSRTVLAKISSFMKTIVNRGGIKKGGFKRSLNGGVIGDHDGHLIAHSLGGNYGTVNLVAQQGALNTSKYAAVENFLRNNRRLIKNYIVKPTYLGQAKRPDKISQLFEFRGGIDNLNVLIKSNPNLKYTKKVDVYGKEIYECLITHSNNLI